MGPNGACNGTEHGEASVAGRGVRLARGWAGATAATFVAALSHVLAGGTVPGVPMLMLSLALSGLVCSMLAGRVLSLWRMSAAVVLSQGLFHWLFSAGTAGFEAAPMAGATPGHAGHGMSPMTIVATGQASPAMDHDAPLMLLFHALAAAVTIALLRRGEVAGVQLLHAAHLCLARFLPRLVPPPLPVRAPPAVPHLHVRVVASLGVPLLAMRHRGPPCTAVVSTGA